MFSTALELRLQQTWCHDAQLCGRFGSAISIRSLSGSRKLLTLMRKVSTWPSQWHSWILITSVGGERDSVDYSVISYDSYKIWCFVCVGSRCCLICEPCVPWLLLIQRRFVHVFLISLELKFHSEWVWCMYDQLHLWRQTCSEKINYLPAVNICTQQQSFLIKRV